MSAEYVRRHYGVNFKRGERLVIDHGFGMPLRHGVLVSFPNQYLGVRFDGEQRTSRVHPKEARRQETSHD